MFALVCCGNIMSKRGSLLIGNSWGSLRSLGGTEHLSKKIRIPFIEGEKKRLEDARRPAYSCPLVGLGTILLLQANDSPAQSSETYPAQPASLNM